MTSFAASLLDHAARIMPAHRREWVRAMRAEITFIPAPSAAAFALGCVQASYTQRIFEMMTFARLARWGLALYALVSAGCYLLVSALTGSIKAHPEMKPEDLGSDPGTAEALIFHQTYPTWQLGAFVLIAVVLLAGAYLLVRKKSLALPLLTLGVGAASLIAVLDRSLVGAAEWPLAWSAPWLIPLASLCLVWWLSRRAPDLTPAH